MDWEQILLTLGVIFKHGRRDISEEPQNEPGLLTKLDKP